MLDSGATNNFISKELALSLELPIQRDVQFDKVQLADGKTLNVYGVTRTKVVFSTFSCLLDFVILDAAIPNIFGIPFFTQINPIIDWQQHIMSFRFGSSTSREVLLEFNKTKNPINRKTLARHVVQNVSISNAYHGLDVD